MEKVKNELSYGALPLSYDIDKEYEIIENENAKLEKENIDSIISDLIKEIKNDYLKVNNSFLSDETKSKLNYFTTESKIATRFISTLISIQDILDYKNFGGRIFNIVKYLLNNRKFLIEDLDIINNSNLIDGNYVNLFVYLIKKGLIKKINIKQIYRLSGYIGSNLPHNNQQPYYFMYLFLIEKLPQSKIKEYEKEYGTLKSKETALSQVMYQMNL